MENKSRGESEDHYSIKAQLVEGLTAAGLDAVDEHRITFPGIRYECDYGDRRDRWATVDIAIPSMKLAIEVEITKPRPSDRWHLLEQHGWRVLRFRFWKPRMERNGA